MAARLRQHAFARIHQDDRRIGGGRAGNHVARVLLVTGCVGDDVLARRGREVTVCHVDGDALLTFGREAVEQQRKIEIAALRTALLGVDRERVHLVFEQHARFIQQAANQRALAVIDAAARDESQQALRSGRGLDPSGNGLLWLQRGCHQKYPSCFFFSIEPALS